MFEKKSPAVNPGRSPWIGAGGAFARIFDT